MAGSALCGAAPSMTAMIVGRALAGMGVSYPSSFHTSQLYIRGHYFSMIGTDLFISQGSGMYFGVLVLLSVSTTIQERPTYIGFT